MVQETVLSVLLAAALMAVFFVLVTPGLTGRVVCSLTGCVNTGVNLTSASGNFADGSDVSDALRHADGSVLALSSGQLFDVAFSDATNRIPEGHILANVTLVARWRLVSSLPTPTNATPTPEPTVEPPIEATVQPSATTEPVATNATAPNASVNVSADANATVLLNTSVSEGLNATSSTGSNATADASNGSSTSNTTTELPSNFTSAPSGLPNPNTSISPSPTFSPSAQPGSTVLPVFPTPSPSVSPSPPPSPTPTSTPQPTIPSDNSSVNASSQATLSSSFWRFDEGLVANVTFSAWTGESFQTVCAVAVAVDSPQDVECPVTSFFENYPLLLSVPKFRLAFVASGEDPLAVDSVELFVSSAPNPSVNETVESIKVKSDARFDAIIDSAEKQDDDLVVIFHHDSPIQLPIFVKGNVDYFLSQNESIGGQNVSLRLFNYSNQYFKLRIGNASEVFEFGQAQDVSLAPRIEDAAGVNHAAQVVLKDSESLVTELVSTSNSAALVAQGEYDVTMKFSDAPVSEITLVRAGLFESVDSLIRLDSLSENQTGIAALNAFAIAPGELSFEKGTFVAQASGSRLLKCPSWVFELQTCPDGWITAALLVPGQAYSVNFTATDPAYAEINATAAEHYDAQGRFVEDIFPAVRFRDGSWSPRIRSGEFVRVTYEHPLENGNVIDSYSRGTQTTRYDVYLAGTQTRVGQSSGASAFGKLSLITMQDLLQPADLFDFRIVDASDPSGYLEFDYIHDAPGEHLYVTANTVLGGGDHVYANVSITNGATLTVGGNLTNTTLTISENLVINGSSTLLLRGNTTSSTAGTGVNVTVANINVSSGSFISANGQGFIGGSGGGQQAGPGAGSGNANGGGGAYGGNGGSGGNAAGGIAYGSLTAPVNLGSGGAGVDGGARAGGAGAGAMFLNVSGTFTLNGEIRANGASSTGGDCCNEGSGGSGGSIYVITNVLNGSGNFSANGGSDPAGNAGAAGGGGGRVAVYYQSAPGFTGFRNSTASGGAGTNQAGFEGTVGFFDTSIASYHLRVFRQFRYEQVNRSWTFGAITVDEGGRLDFSGNSTVAVLGNITVTGSSVLNASGYSGSGSNGAGVNFSAANIRIDSGSRFSADTQGYTGGSGGGQQLGPGAGSGNANGGGGGYGGVGGSGGNAAGGIKYGSWTAPVDLGSGGAGVDGGARRGGAGGGAIFLNVSGTVTLSGELTARGGNSTGGDCCNEGSGGSGGSIYVVTNTLTGSGLLSANGGQDPVGNAGAAGGGGGRIAVYYQSASGFTGFTSASGAGGSGTNQAGFYGTIAFFDTSIPSYHLNVFQHLSYDTPGVSLTFGAITVNGSGMLNFSGDSLVTVNGNLTLNGNAVLNVSSSSNRGVNITAGNITVASGARIIADYQGFSGGLGGGQQGGPGAGGGNSNGGGGGYGGVGGSGGNAAGGTVYGSLTVPLDLGSGGAGVDAGARRGGAGGGALFLNVSGTLALNGRVTSLGQDSTGSDCCNEGSGGSGGSIYVVTNTLNGVGNFSAIGGSAPAGNANSAGGGGGRIAVYYQQASGFSGFAATSASGGSNSAGQYGTVVFFDTSIADYHLHVYQTARYTQTNATLRFGQLTLRNGGNLAFAGNSTVIVTGNLTVQDSSNLSVNSMILSGNRGFGVNFTVANFTLTTGSMLSGDEHGFRAGLGAGEQGGPGAGAGNANGGGGAYGGSGGAGGNAAGGAVYGSLTTPVDLGSGGAGVDGSSRRGGAGGGAVFLNVSETLATYGRISVQGGNSTGADCCNEGSGGSGGSIYVVTNRLMGNGTFLAGGGSAPAGNANSAGGGGGRVAVYYQSASGFTGLTTSTALGGSNSAGQSGTVGFFDTSVAGTHFYLYKDFRYLTPGANVSYTAITLNNSAVLDIAGNSTVSVTNLTVANSMIILRGNYTTNSNGRGVNVSVVNLDVDAASLIHADYQGYAGGSGGGQQSGPGAGVGNANGGGGGYGGTGGSGSSGAGGVVYGSLTAPVDLGSGGAGVDGGVRRGGAGGGAIFLNVSGTFTLNGRVTALGEASTGADCCNEGSGGSGGSIYVVTNTLSGVGNFSTNGGSAPAGNANSAGGGGGRIAVHYQTASGFTGFTTSFANGGSNSAGQSGTVGFIDTSVASNHLWIYQAFRYTAPSTSATWGALTLTNGGDLDVAGNSTITVLGNLTVTGSSTLNVRGNYTSGTNGRGVNLTTGNFTLDAGSRVLADGQGYAGGNNGGGASGTGTGGGAGGWNGGGGGYGGAGGAGSGGAGGITYGSNTAPVDLGSGGAGGNGARVGGFGGGAVFIRASDQMAVNGNVTARGADSTGGDCCNEGAGGSGGSIYLFSNVFSGYGFIAANGGNSPAGNANSGTGGGGRVAIHYGSNASSGNVSVLAGATGGGLGAAGTIYGQALDLTAPTVTLNDPASGNVSTAATVSFNATATDSIHLNSATLFSNFSGAWAANNSNTTNLANNTPFVISVTGIPQGYYVWNMQSCDNSSNCGFASANRTLTVDTAAPSLPQIVTPTLANNSFTAINSVFVNATFNELLVSQCLLSVNQTLNYTMTLSNTGLSRYCSYNFTGVTDGLHNYTVYVNDSAGRLASNGSFFVTVDVSSPSALTFVSPTLANGSTTSAVTVDVNLTFTESNPDSCVLEFDNGTRANFSMARSGNSCYRSHSVTVNGNYNYTVFVNDSAGNRVTSSRRFVTRAELSSEPTPISSGGGSAPTPTLAPTPTPTSVASMVKPTPASTPKPTPVYEESEQLFIEPESTIKPAATVAPGDEPAVVAPDSIPVIELRRSLTVEELPVSATGTGIDQGVAQSSGRFVSTYTVTLVNKGDGTINKVELTQHFPFIECRGPDPKAYEAVGIHFTPPPLRIECGSAVVTWLFNNVEPGEEQKAQVQVPERLEKKDVESVSTARVIARQLKGGKEQEVEVRIVSEPKPASASFDYTLPALGVLVLLLGAGVFFFMRRQGGNGGESGGFGNSGNV